MNTTYLPIEPTCKMVVWSRLQGANRRKSASLVVGAYPQDLCCCSNQNNEKPLRTKKPVDGTPTTGHILKSGDKLSRFAVQGCAHE